jgi:hypothetical protein
MINPIRSDERWVESVIIAIESAKTPPIISIKIKIKQRKII